MECTCAQNQGYSEGVDATLPNAGSSTSDLPRAHSEFISLVMCSENFTTAMFCYESQIRLPHMRSQLCKRLSSGVLLLMEPPRSPRFLLSKGRQEPRCTGASTGTNERLTASEAFQHDDSETKGLAETRAGLGLSSRSEKEYTLTWMQSTGCQSRQLFLPSDLWSTVHIPHQGEDTRSTQCYFQRSSEHRPRTGMWFQSQREDS